tara:strand:+ start:311 stop:493 length:183 start_codon:yes stop_codon:yes gene_type:complete
MFRHIKTYIAIKSTDVKGIKEGFEDMTDEGKVPFVKPFKYKKEWILIIVEYKKTELWIEN